MADMGTDRGLRSENGRGCLKGEKMFLLITGIRTESGRFSIRDCTPFNDIKDLGDAVVGITGEECIGSDAITIAGCMRIGDVFKSDLYTIECVRED